MKFSLSQVIKYSFEKGLQMACQVSFADEGFVTSCPKEASETNKEIFVNWIMWLTVLH
jgi:hypothetical protein